MSTLCIGITSLEYFNQKSWKGWDSNPRRLDEKRLHNLWALWAQAHFLGLRLNFFSWLGDVNCYKTKFRARNKIGLLPRAEKNSGIFASSQKFRRKSFRLEKKLEAFFLEWKLRHDRVNHIFMGKGKKSGGATRNDRSKTFPSDNFQNSIIVHKDPCENLHHLKNEVSWTMVGRLSLVVLDLQC